jgi:hypothetical protein
MMKGSRGKLAWALHDMTLIMIGHRIRLKPSHLRGSVFFWFKFEFQVPQVLQKVCSLHVNWETLMPSYYHTLANLYDGVSWYSRENPLKYFWEDITETLCKYKTGRCLARICPAITSNWAECTIYSCCLRILNRL